LVRELDRLLEALRWEELLPTAELSRRSKALGLGEPLGISAIATANSDMPRRPPMLSVAIREAGTPLKSSEAFAGGGVSDKEGVLE
jgi:hypothetical protein